MSSGVLLAILMTGTAAVAAIALPDEPVRTQVVVPVTASATAEPARPAQQAAARPAQQAAVGPAHRAAPVSRAESSTAAEDCLALEPGRFGALSPAQQAVTRPLAFREEQCIAVDVPAGPYKIRAEPWNSLISVVDDSGETVCPEGVADSCLVRQAGRHTLRVSGTYGAVQSFRVAFIPLSGTQGCGAPTGTAWNLPPTSFVQTSSLEIFCHRIEARPGERVIGYSTHSTSHIANADGSWVCDSRRYPQSVGCTLPTTGGPFRFLAFPKELDTGTRVVDLEVHSISHPVGCSRLPVASFGAAPVPASTSQCRVFTAPKAGRYLIAENYEKVNTPWLALADAYGEEPCAYHRSGEPCALDAGTYTVTTVNYAPDDEPFAVNVVPLDGAGCVTVNDREQNVRTYPGRISAPTELDCLEVPASMYGTLGLYQWFMNGPLGGRHEPTGPTMVRVYGPDGQPVCSGVNGDKPICGLARGAGPYRVVITGQPHQPVVDYVMAVQELHDTTGCRALPGVGYATTVQVSPERHVDCLTITTDRVENRPLLVRASAGADPVLVHVYQDGGTVCAFRSSEPARNCRLEPGPAKIVVVSTGKPATYRVGYGSLGTVPCQTGPAGRGGSADRPAVTGDGGPIRCTPLGRLK